MNNPADHGTRLERRIDALLHELPDVAAPASLEARVFAQLEQLALQRALPWWRQGFTRWPLAARILFVPVAAASVWLALMLFARLASGFGQATATLPVAGRTASSWQALTSTAGSLWDLVTHAVPMQWIYAGAVGAAVLYVMFFSLSAVAMRTLLLTPNSHRT
jgi:hypothetical protein